jgi:hypothetical protein
MVMSVAFVLIVLVVFRSKFGGDGMEIGVTARLAPVGVAHDFLLLAEAFRSRRGHSAWAPCHTLVVMLCGKSGWVKAGARRERFSKML